MRSTDDSLRGILLAVSATVLFSSSDTISKYLSSGLPVVEFIWIRYALNTLLALCLARPVPRSGKLPRRPVWQIMRGLCAVGSSVLFVMGVRQMTMAQATTISFLSPLLVTILSIPILGEVVGVRRWAAVAAGMLGMLVVVRPGLGDFQPAALFGVASATCWALALILTRLLADQDPPRTTVLWSSACGLIVLSALLPFVAVWPSWPQLGLSFVMGVVASGGQFLVILAHRHAQASTLAPFFYTQLLGSSFLGFLVFDNVPDQWTGVGAAIIIASGLYTAHRERLRGRTLRVERLTQPVAKASAAV